MQPRAWVGIELVLDRESGPAPARLRLRHRARGEPLPAEAPAEELRHFPRPPESVPDWWAGRIGERG
jgi:hypothetical protein